MEHANKYNLKNTYIHCTGEAKHEYQIYT